MLLLLTRGGETREVGGGVDGQRHARHRGRHQRRGRGPRREELRADGDRSLQILPGHRLHPLRVLEAAAGAVLELVLGLGAGSLQAVDGLEHGLGDNVRLGDGNEVRGGAGVGEGGGGGGGAGGRDVGHLLLELPELVVLGVEDGEEGGDADGVTQHRVQALHDDHPDPLEEADCRHTAPGS